MSTTTVMASEGNIYTNTILEPNYNNVTVYSSLGSIYVDENGFVTFEEEDEYWILD